MKFCPTCKTKYEDSYNFCHYCGKNLISPSFKCNSSGIEFVYVKGGLVKHETVTLLEDCKIITYDVRDFYISKFLITQQDYMKVTGKNPSVFNGNTNPVDSVPFYEAKIFCDKLSELEGLEKYDFDKENNGYRLPTEAEWLYAFNGGNETSRYKYSGSNDYDKVAWFMENSNQRTHPVGEKEPNELGIYDMSGNVSEFTTEYFHEWILHRGWGWNKSVFDIENTSNAGLACDTQGVDYIGFRIVRSC
jgi:formylglycine-generating enzyme required for sulfatase activity